MKKIYVSFCMNQNKKEAKVTRDMIIDSITDIWYNSSVINKDLIYYSFRVCDLSNQ